MARTAKPEIEDFSLRIEILATSRDAKALRKLISEGIEDHMMAVAEKSRGDIAMVTVGKLERKVK